MKQANPNKLIVDAHIGEYYLIWYQDIPDNCDRGYVGVIKNKTNDRINVEIHIDDHFMIDHNRRNCALWFNDETYLDTTEIVVTKEFFDKAINGDEEISLLWHEIGHFHTDWRFPEYVGPDQSKIRKEYIEKEEVHPAEYVADLMAAYYSGVDAVAHSLRRAAINRSRSQDINASMAWWELRTRRKMIQQLQTEEDIEAELCRVCEVESIEEL